MDIFTRSDLETLLQEPAKWAISIYLPTHRTGRQVMQNPIRFKNLLTQAEEKLEAQRGPDPEMQKDLEPAQALLQDELFWQHQSDGLVVFVSPGFFHYYRLPLNFEPLPFVGERFYFKPLLPLLSGDGRFYILALSQGEVRLLQGSRSSVNEVSLKDIPESLQEALRFDDPEKQLQFHTGTTDRRGSRPAIFYGHGVGGDEAEQKANIERFFHQVDEGIQQILATEITLSDGAPLILAGVDYVLSIYREVNSYPHLLEKSLKGNPEEQSPEQLHQEAWTVVEPYFQQDQQNALDRYWDRSKSQLTSTALGEILPAAHEGRIETLFVARQEQRWGNFDRASWQVDLHQEKQPGDQELLDEAALQTLLQGGAVYVVDPDKVPEKGSAAAIFRYSSPRQPSEEMQKEEVSSE